MATNVKIKIFVISTKFGEDSVNSWIEENNIDVIDIKYQCIVVPQQANMPPKVKDRVLIMYREGSKK